MFWSPQIPTFSPCRCLLNLNTDLVAAPRWPGETEGTLISLLRKWPHKSDRETHLWLLVKVLLLITSNIRDAEGGLEMESSRPGSRCQQPQHQRQELTRGFHSYSSVQRPGLGTALDSALLWAYAEEAFPMSPLLVRWAAPPSFPTFSRSPHNLLLSPLSLTIPPYQ